MDQLGDLPARDPSRSAPSSSTRSSRRCSTQYAEYTPEAAEHVRPAIDADTIREIAEIIGAHPTKFASHNWRAAGAGNLGGWQVARCLFFLNVLTGSVATKGGTAGQRLEQVHAARRRWARQPITKWNELSGPRSTRSLPRDVDPAAPLPQRGPRASSTSTSRRVYNPIWTNPDGFTWMEALHRRGQGPVPRRAHPDVVRDGVVRRLRAADGRRRRNVTTSHSYETHAGRWIGFRQSVLRRYAELKTASTVGPERPQPRVQPGRGVGGERVLDRPVLADRPRRFARHPPVVRERRATPARRSASTSTTARMFADSVPGLADAPQRPAVRRRSSTCVTAAPTPCRATRTNRTSSRVDPADARRLHARTTTACSASPARPAAWDGADDHARRPHARQARRRITGASSIDGEVKEGFPTPSKKLELYSTTLADWGWPEYATPTWIPSHVHWEDLDLAGNERILLPDVPDPDADPHPIGATRSGSTRSATVTRCGSTPPTPSSSASRRRASSGSPPASATS